MYQLDTSIVSEYSKRRPAREILDWVEGQHEQRLFLSCLTIAELHKGLVKLETRAQSQDEFRRASKIKRWIEKVEDRFEGRVLPISQNVLTTWARLCGNSEARGTTLPVIDSLLAASAIASQLSLVTTNVQDFRKYSPELEVISPLVTEAG